VAITDLISKIKNDVREAEPDDIVVPDDLSGIDDILPPDPPPARKTSRSSAPKAAPKPTAAVKRQVADSLTMMITIPAGIAVFRDPVCAGAVLAHVDNIVDKLVPIVSRSPGLLRWFTEGAGYMDWLALATALAPVARTFWDHHAAGGREDDGDRTPDDYSQYAAPAFI
jgi:hypothetical protein